MQYDFDNTACVDEDYLYEEPFSGQTGKSPEDPEQEAQKRTFVELYNAYMHPPKPLSAFRAQCLLDDMYSQLPKLFAGWVFRYAAVYHRIGCKDVDPLIACSVGCQYAYEQIKQDKSNNICREYPVSFYLTVARNRSIDHYFAKTPFGRLPRRKKDGTFDEKEIQKRLENMKGILEVSMDGMLMDEDGVYHDDRDTTFSTNPFEQMCLSRRMNDARTNSLSMLLLKELMNYPDEPQKPLALMYGRILFQLAKEYGGHDAISKAAQKSKKDSSPAWAHQRMGKLTLEELGDKSEQVVQQCYDKTLVWGNHFRQYMLRSLADGTNRTWSEIVYTESYTEGQTSNWIESISNSMTEKCARKLFSDPDLRDIAEEKLSAEGKLRKTIEKIEKKEACR